MSSGPPDARAEFFDALGRRVARGSRLHDRHAIGLQFTAARRDPSFSDVIDSPQSVGAISLFYTFLGDTNFGVVR